VQRIFLDNHNWNLVRRTPDSSQLGEDVMTIAILFQHTAHPSRLALDPLQASY
jgi:hypothetical protein